MRSLIFVLGTFVTLSAGAQNSNSSLSRRATSAGSYPFYFTVGYSSVASTIKELQRITGEQPLPDLFKRGGKRFCPNGMAFKVGVVLTSERYATAALPNWLIELDFNNYVKGLRAKNEGTLIFHFASASFRMGVRHLVFYPLVLQFTAGPIIYQNTTMFLNSTGSPNEGVKVSVPQEKGPVGIEYRIRASAVDPAGTGGGIGFFIEFQVSDFFQEALTELEPLYEAVGRANYYTRPNLDYRAFNFGVIIPLALPFR